MNIPRSFSRRWLSKTAPYLLGPLLIAAALWACSSPEPSPTPPPPTIENDPTPAPTPDLQPTSEMTGTVSVWVTWKPEAVRTLNELMETFQERHPGFAFSISYIPEDELRIALDQTDKLPSIVFAPSTWAKELYEAGLTQDLSDQPTDQLRVLVHPLPWSQANYQGQVLGIPTRMHGNVLYRNREVAPIPAGTLEGLVETDEALRGTFNEGMAQDYGFQNMGPFSLACGGPLMLDGSPPDITSPVATCWLELLRDLSPAGPVVFNSDEDRILFEGGTAGWMIESTEHFDELSEALGEAALSIDPWPVYEATGGPLAGYVWTENAYFSSEQSPDDFEAAWEFIEFLLSEDSQLALSNPNGAAHIPVHISAPPLPGHVGQMHAALLDGTALPMQEPRPEFVEVLERAARAVSVLGTPVELALQRAITELAAVPDV